MLGILTIFIIGFAGILLLEHFSKHKLDGLLLLPSCFLLGITITTSQLFFASLLFGYWKSIYLLAVNGLLITGVLYFFRYRLLELTKTSYAFVKHISLPYILLTIILLIVTFFIYHSQLQNPFIHSDSLNYWFMKGKLFYEDKAIKASTLTNPDFLSNLAQFPKKDAPYAIFFPVKYPILVPLIITWTATIDGNFNIISLKYLWLAIELVIILQLAWLGGYIFKGWKYALLFGPLLYLGIPSWTHHISFHNFGFADIWLAAFLLSGISLTYFFLEQEKKIYAIMASIFLAAASFTRVEGIIGLCLLPLFIFYKNMSMTLKGLLGLILISLGAGWYGFASSLKDTGNVGQFIDNTTKWQVLLPKIMPTFLQMMLKLFNVQDFLILWPLFIISMIIVLIKRVDHYAVLWLKNIIFIFLIFFTLNYTLGTPVIGPQFMDGTIVRYLGQLVPTVIFILLLNFRQLLPIFSTKK